MDTADPASILPKVKHRFTLLPQRREFLPQLHRFESKNEQRVSAGNRDALLSVEQKRNRIRPDRAPGLKFPQELATTVVEREEIAFVAPAENDPSGRRPRPRPRRRVEAE